MDPAAARSYAVESARLPPLKKTAVTQYDCLKSVILQTHFDKSTIARCLGRAIHGSLNCPDYFHRGSKPSFLSAALLRTSALTKERLYISRRTQFFQTPRFCPSIARQSFRSLAGHETHLITAIFASSFQPVDFDFLFQGLEFRIAGHQLGSSFLGQRSGESIGVSNAIVSFVDRRLPRHLEIVADADNLYGQRRDFLDARFGLALRCFPHCVVIDFAPVNHANEQLVPV